jgi:uncharacterized protein YjbJ (UPF0337 family)
MSQPRWVSDDRPGGIPVLKADFRAETHANRRGRIMGAEDKASNKIDDVGGKAKEALGKVTGDKDTEDKGKVDQAKSSLKDPGEKVKDAFKS